MKKIIILMILSMTLYGCEFNKDPYEGAIIYSTVYPVSYIMDKLYGDYSEINSIYPQDAEIKNYTLTDKQISNYADTSDFFVYVGLTDEINYAKNFVNKNKNIILIDSTMNLKISSSVEELWLNPNNYLMLAKNIRDNLFETIENQYILEVVDEKYNELSETLSIMDAELRQIANAAINNSNTMIVATSDAFMYLENFGFTVISLENESYKSEEALESIKSNFKSGRYLALINEYGDDNEFINDLIENCEADEINMKTFYSSASDEDYMEALSDFIFNLEIIVNK